MSAMKIGFLSGRMMWKNVTLALPLIIMMLSLRPLPGWAESHIEQYRFGDTQLATVVLAKDRDGEIQRKLGSQPCVVPASNRTTMSHFYRSGEGIYLRFDLNGDGVESMTMSLDPIVSGVCYAPLGRSIQVITGKGLHLGDAVEKVTQLYGEPTQMFKVGSLVRFRYDSDGELDRYYEWDLVFRDGRLVEWTAYSRD